MGRKREAVTAYIDKQQSFARPILTRLRALFHRACPQIDETIKWGMPHFDHKGLVAGIAGFKQHVRCFFWKGGRLKDPHGAVKAATRLTSLDDVPADSVLVDLIRQACALNESGVKSRSRGRGAAVRKKPRPAPKTPVDLAAALKRNAKASATFKQFSPSHQREYIEWITEAKQPQTRARRLAQTIEWLAEGKPRNWKYMQRT